MVRQDKRSFKTFIYFFADIDECLDEARNECDSNAECTNTEGSYNCICSPGYFGTGKVCEGKHDTK